jgi:hypothetical protein
MNDKPMDREKHIARHKELHKMLDEIVADWISCSEPVETRLPSEHSVMDLMKWSYDQTINPTDPSS